MRKVGVLKFVQVSEPITEQKTKFGGQPVWVEAPEWPISKSTRRQLTFLGQICLDERLFGNVQGRVAYLFINTNEDADETWDADSGEIAVIVQPGVQSIEVEELATGPTAQHRWDTEFDKSLPCEFEANIDIVDEPERGELDYYVSKIGGTPDWVQFEAFPFEHAKLVFQIEDSEAPFQVNFGTGLCYAFINDDGNTGKMLWQC